MPSLTDHFIAFGLIGLAVAWIPLWLERAPISLPMLAVASGLAYFTIKRDEVSVLDYRVSAEVLTELALIISVMGAGLRIDRPFSLRTWATTWRLLGLVMPLSVVAIAFCSTWMLGLPVGLALLLGGILAPTDPVLASAVQVGPPGSGQKGEVPFALTSEAGLNDGLAFPFVLLGIMIVERGSSPADWLGEWVRSDLIWKIGAALVLGTGLGWGLVTLNRFIPERFRLVQSRDGLISVAITTLVYGFSELIGCYGFVAVFAAAVALRNSSQALEYQNRLANFAEQVERLAAAIVLGLFGGAIAQGALANLSWAEAAFGVLVLLGIRPVVTLISFTGSRQTIPERLALGYFGVRGLGSLYYGIYAANHLDRLPSCIWSATFFVVLLSVVLYGTTVGAVMRRLGLQGRS